MNEIPGLIVYRVRTDVNHPKRHVRKAWYGRTWQAEWDGCLWAPRAYTKAGLLRKASRRSRWSPERAHRYWLLRRLIRDHITRRSERWGL